MEGYNRILNEFNERMMIITQQSSPIGAGPGGSDDVQPPAVFGYTPTSQLLNWTTGPYWSGASYSNVTLADFTANVNSLDVQSLEISSTANKITSITGFNTLANLNTVYIADQLLSIALDVSSNTNLVIFEIYNCGLTGITLPNTTLLEEVYVWNNQLTTLDVSNLVSMTNLYCSDNLLTSLDVSNSPDLFRLYCYNNQLTSLNISNNPNLYRLWALNNSFSQTVVDNILITLANYSVSGGQAYLYGTGNAAPSAAGITAKNILLSRGWTVITN